MFRGLLFFSVLFPIFAWAGVNEKWVAETTEINPHAITAYHGETVNMTVTFTENGRIIRPSSASASFLWQTNGMGTAWWSTNATYKCGVVTGSFGPTMDTGAADVTFFFWVTDGKGGNYRANGTINLLDSPFLDIHILGTPTKILDFGLVSVTNADLAPFALKGEAGGGVTTNDVTSIISNTVTTTYIEDRIGSVGGVTAKAATNIAEYVVSTNGFLKTHQSLEFTNDYRRIDGKINWNDVTNREDVATTSITNGFATTAYVDSCSRTLAVSSTNYTDTVSSNVSVSATNYTDSATNALWSATTNAITAATTNATAILPAVSNIATKTAAAMKPTKLGSYLWEVGTEGEDWDMATNRLATVYPSWGGGCSGVKAGNYHGRNLDWYYDKGASIIVRSPAREGKYGAIGVAGGLKMMTDDFMMSEKWDDSYYSLPFTWTDGMNEKGVVIQSNVIPKDTTKSATWRTKRSGCIVCFAIIRYVLDRCATAQEAAQMINDKMFMPSEFNYDDHFLVSDLISSYIVEDGHVYSTSEIPTDLLTNFRCGTASYNANKTVVWSTVETYGQGLERYDLVRTNGNDNTTLNGLVATMKGLWYTKSYLPTTVPYWYTECCGPESETGYPNLTVMNAKDNPSVFAGIVASERADYLAEHDKTSSQYRGGKTWQTVHTAIYDQKNLTLRLYTQEDPASERYFKLVQDSPEIATPTTDYETVTNIAEYVISTNMFFQGVATADVFNLPTKGKSLSIQSIGTFENACLYLIDSTGWVGGISPEARTFWMNGIRFSTYDGKWFFDGFGNKSDTYKGVLYLPTLADTDEKTIATSDAIASLASNYVYSATISGNTLSLSSYDRGILKSSAFEAMSLTNVTCYHTTGLGWDGVPKGYRIVPDEYYDPSSGDEGYWALQTSYGRSAGYSHGYKDSTELRWTTDWEGGYPFTATRQMPYATSNDTFVTSIYVGQFAKTNDIVGLASKQYVASQSVTNGGAVNYANWKFSQFPQYVPDPSNPTFSNAVLSVGLNIDTNSVAVLNEIAATFGGFPITGTATTLGGLLLALAAAIAWLKKNTVKTDDGSIKMVKVETEGDIPDPPDPNTFYFVTGS